MVAVFVVINICLGAFLLAPHSSDLPEIKALAGKDASFKDLSNYFTDLANKKGAVYAFDVLKTAPIPPNIDIHLLGHIIGDILYKQQGAKGILHCTQDFRNACSHTIVIGTLLEKGPDSFGEIADLCRKAPGGPGAYTMCFHGLGHGVLAFNGYDLPKAVKMCEKSGTGLGPEYTECVGGTIMEMIAGVHDPQVWAVQAKKYFKADDPLYPCTADFIPHQAKGICYTYITPHLFLSAGANLGHPDPETFAEAFSYCEPLSGGDRASCLGGFGKEFVVLAQNRDVRAIDKMTDDQLGMVLSWCDKSSSKDGKIDCVVSSLNSLYWGGENDPGASVRFCNLAETKGWGQECADSLIGAAKFFTKDPVKLGRICTEISSTYQSECRQKLSL